MVPSMWRKHGMLRGDLRMNGRRLVALTITILGAVLFLPPATAQRRGGGMAGARAPQRAGSVRAGARAGYGYRGRGQYGFGYYPGWAYLPPPYYYGYGDEYDDYGPEGLPAPPPWLAARAEQSPAPPKPIEPLVIERQGDEWVRIDSKGQPPASAASTKPASGQAPRSTSDKGIRNNVNPPAPKLPPAVLVFHDGRQLEIEKYTIIGRVIYCHTNYWTTGSWTQKIAIADLDIAATLELNRERGGKFSLPSGPNEVVFRP